MSQKYSPCFKCCLSLSSLTHRCRSSPKHLTPPLLRLKVPLFVLRLSFVIDNCVIPRSAFIHVSESLSLALLITVFPSNSPYFSFVFPFLPISVSSRHQGFPSFLVTLAPRVLSWHGAPGVRRRPSHLAWRRAVWESTSPASLTWVGLVQNSNNERWSE